MMQGSPRGHGAAVRDPPPHLDMQLFLASRPELYSSGGGRGFEKVFEINRTSATMGCRRATTPSSPCSSSTRPTRLPDLMNLTEEMLRGLMRQVLGSTVITYQAQSYRLRQAVRALHAQGVDQPL